MSALSVYVSTAQLVLETDTVCEQRLLDLHRLFSELRQLMSCVVCCQLLSDPYAPQNGRCPHNVCRLCVRGRKAQRPTCNNCKDFQDFKTYIENRQMRFLLLCYKSLCEHMIGTTLYAQLGKHKPNNTMVNSGAVLNSNGGMLLALSNISTLEIIMEGASYDDVLNSFNNDLPRAPVPRLQVQTVTALATQIPPISTTAVAPLAPATSIHIRTHSQIAPKAATPPTSASSSSTASYSATAAQIIKQEYISPPLPPASAATQMPNTVPSLHTPVAPTQTSSFSIKHLKHIVDHSSVASTSLTAIANSALPASTHTITYVGNNPPGIVVPIASSSMTTTAPLTIASAKLLNRQWARNTALGMASSSTSASKLSTTTAGDQINHPPLTYKVSSLTSIAPSTSSLSAVSTSSSVSSSINVTATCNNNTATTAVTTTATVTSQQIRNPPSIKTVSNGSAMYSVLYTGIGNKITIKRKTDGDEDAAQRQKIASTSATAQAVFRQLATAAKVNPKRRGCRCGNATPTPGKLTCCGQRCPCYVDSKSCIGCKCRGCRNPHRPDGGKVRPVIPELACYEIQMADENSSLSPSELPIGMSVSTPQTVTTTTSATTYAECNSPQQQQQQHLQHLDDYAINQQSIGQSIAPPLSSQPLPQLSSLTPSTSSSSASTATLIPFRNLPQLTTAAPTTTQNSSITNSGNQQQHQLTQQQSNMLQLENLQRESVLIQNAEGKYQVVNVFTTALHNQHQSSSQISSSGFQRIHTLSQLQAAAVGGSGATNTISVLPTNINCTTPVSACNTTTTTYQQQHPITTTHHHHQHQHHQHQLQRISGTSNAAAISLQLQQQLKQNNIITVHPIASHATTTTHQQQQTNAHHHTQTTTIPLMSAPTSAAASTPATTITLSPIIVTSPNTFTSDMFSSDSSEEFLSINNAAAAATANVMSSSSSMSHNSTTPINATHIVSTTIPTAQPSPQFATQQSMIEVIDSNDVRLLPFDGFANY